MKVRISSSINVTIDNELLRLLNFPLFPRQFSFQAVMILSFSDTRKRKRFLASQFHFEKDLCLFLVPQIAAMILQPD